MFKNTWFQRFARKERIDDADLGDAMARAEKGQIDAASRQLAAEVLALSGEQLDALVTAGRFMEAGCDGDG